MNEGHEEREDLFGFCHLRSIQDLLLYRTMTQNLPGEETHVEELPKSVRSCE